MVQVQNGLRNGQETSPMHIYSNQIRKIESVVKERFQSCRKKN